MEIKETCRINIELLRVIFVSSYFSQIDATTHMIKFFTTNAKRENMATPVPSAGPVASSQPPPADGCSSGLLRVPAVSASSLKLSGHQSLCRPSHVHTAPRSGPRLRW